MMTHTGISTITAASQTRWSTNTVASIIILSIYVHLHTA